MCEIVSEGVYCNYESDYSFGPFPTLTFLTLTLCINVTLQGEITDLQWDPTGHMFATTGATCNVLKVWQVGTQGISLAHSLLHESRVTCCLWCPIGSVDEGTRLTIAR